MACLKQPQIRAAKQPPAAVEGSRTQTATFFPRKNKKASVFRPRLFDILCDVFAGNYFASGVGSATGAASAGAAAPSTAGVALSPSAAAGVSTAAGGAATGCSEHFEQPVNANAEATMTKANALRNMFFISCCIDPLKTDAIG
jgi:hypothetical protein